MNKKVINILEYNKVIEKLVSFAASAPGKDKCRLLMPMNSLADIENAQTLTSDALTRIYRKGAPYFSSVKNISASFLRLQVGSSLGAGELLGIASLLNCAAECIAYNKEFDDNLTEMFASLVPLTHLYRDITRCIISEEEISDDASSTLKNIRRSMKNTNARIHDQLNSILNSSRNLLQDALITMRNGRYCLPVRTEARSSFPGMIHDQSKAGSTLFIEPMSVVKLNNELKELESKENEEIERILAELSAMAASECESIIADYNTLTELDFIFARGKLAHSMKATRPLFNTKGLINLKKARHPLIASDNVVPIDVYTGENFKHLIITGPNTGGKTVTLKTVGLFTLMGQAGLHIPASDNSLLSVFNEVYADIGDEQSIEQSLSTFSSHMTNIVSILKKADSHSLVLFDELCTGTDPEEGAALAISILDNLLKRNVTVFATTHYSELKLYAIATKGVQNACCEFDVQTLKPTYHLLIGIPGKSNAFAISKRLGLPNYIIDDAGRRIDTDNQSFEDVLGDIEAARIDIEKQKAKINEKYAEAEKLRKRLKEKNDRIDKAKDKILRRANEEARDILQQAKDYADSTLKKYNQLIQNSGSAAELEKERASLREKINDKDNALMVREKKKQPHKKLSPDSIRIGDSVHVVSLGLDGTIISQPDQKGMVQVQMGILTSSVSVKDLTLIDKKEEPAIEHKVSSSYNLSKARDIRTEINLIGKTTYEAITLLDKYLDDAYLSHLSQVTVIHGRGTGALKRAVHDHLKHVNYVKSYRVGEFGEGDQGVTIVEFKN